MVADVTQATGLFWATTLGATLGVVAGTGIQYFLTIALDNRRLKRQRRSLQKEMLYNLALVKSLNDEARALRDAVNGRVLNRYFGYFYFGKGLLTQANNMLASGTFYDVLSEEDVLKAQGIANLFSSHHENWVNSQITQRKIAFDADSNNFDHVETVAFVDYVEKLIRELQKDIEALIKRLGE